MTLLRALVVVGAAVALNVHAEAPVSADVDENTLIDNLTPPAGTRAFGADAKASTHAGRASLLIEFETNSSALTDAARKQLDVVGRALNTSRLAAFHFTVEGHADPRGSPTANLRLSQARAESVRDYLVHSQNVATARLTPLGKGDREPLNRANPAAPENRRVTFVTLQP